MRFEVTDEVKVFTDWLDKCGVWFDVELLSTKFEGGYVNVDGILGLEEITEFIRNIRTPK
jgi:hypothetical protein